MIHIVLIGNSQVGKSSLFQRLLHNDFSESFCCTISPTYGVYRDKYILYDLPGSMRWRIFAHPYLKIADAAIIVYNEKEKKSIAEWEAILLEINRKKIPILTVCNKIDIHSPTQSGNTLYISCKEDSKLHEKFDPFFSTLYNNPKISMGWLEYFYLMLPSVEDVTYRMYQIFH